MRGRIKPNFVRGGYVYPNDKYLRDAGIQGRYWSSSPHFDDTYAYSLILTANSVTPSNYYTRYFGGPLRCLAR